MDGDLHPYRPELRVPQSGFDTAVEILMAALLAFAPLAYGAAEAWSQLVVAALVAAMALCLAMKLTLDRSTRLATTWAMLPILLFVALAGVQLLPLPANVVGLVSPNAVGMRRLLLADAMPAAASAPQTISLYAFATARDLRSVLVVAAVFVVVLNVYRRPEQVKRLLLTVSLVGLAVAAVAAHQNLTEAKTVYGIVPAAHANSGPFMNHSHFGQFMNMSIGAALGLMLVLMRQHAKSIDAFATGQLRRLPERPTRTLVLLGFTFVFGAAMVVLSLTRMGVLSALVAGALSAVVLSLRGSVQGRGSLIASLGILVLAVLFYFGFDVAYDRLATLRQMHVAEGGRTQILRDLVTAFRQFPITGTGLGTHEFVFPAFDRTTVSALATHAENEYAELLEETGVPGLLCALAFLAIVARSWVICVWSPRRSIHYAAYGLGFGMLAILIHSGSDFGQHMPANAILTATFAALLIRLSRFGSVARQPTGATAELLDAPRLRLRLGLRVASVLVVCGVSGWVLVNANSARAAEEAWAQSQYAADGLTKSGWRGTDDEYRDLLRPTMNAVEQTPANVTYRHWLNVYRWKAISRPTSETDDAIVLTPQTRQFASQIVDELNVAIAICPTFGPAHTVAGQIERFVLDRPQGVNRILTGFKLSPYDPTSALVVADLAASEARWDDARAVYAVAMKLGVDRQQVISAYVREHGRPQEAHAVAAGDRFALDYLAGLLDAVEGQRELAAQCRTESQRLLRAAAVGDDAPANTIASVAQLHATAGENEQAITEFRRAIARDYGRPEWHYQLAGLLAKTGRIAEATESARICLKLRPQMTEAEQLLSDLSARTASH